VLTCEKAVKTPSPVSAERQRVPQESPVEKLLALSWHSLMERKILLSVPQLGREITLRNADFSGCKE